MIKMITVEADLFKHKPGASMLPLKQTGAFNLVPASTIGELPGFELSVSVHSPTRAVLQLFDQYPDISGVIIRESRIPAMLCRKDLLQILSRPFGNDLFLNRPLSSTLHNITLKQFYLPEEMRIEDAIFAALQRPENEMYEPILVVAKNNRRKILDFHVLLMAQTQLLEHANRFIRQQVETGYTLSLLMDLDQVLRQILQDLSLMVPYLYGAIYLFDHKNRTREITHIFSTWPLPIAIMDPIQNDRLMSELLHTGQPKFLAFTTTHPDVAQPQEFTIQSWLGFPFIYSDQIIGLLSLVRGHPEASMASVASEQITTGSFNKSDAEIVRSLSATFTAAIRNAQLLNELHTLSETDPLTNILNRRGFFEKASQRIHDAPENTEFAILILDMDHFKQVNDLFGHQAGDLVLQKVAEECKRQLRQTDLLGRYGGEEFIVLLPDTDTTGAQYVAERLRLAIANLEVKVNYQKVSITVSAGGTSFFSPDRSIDRFLHQADEALYDAKAKGRNCFCMWSDQHPNGDLDKVQQTLTLLQSNSQVQPASIESSLDITSLIRNEGLENESILGLVQALELREKEAQGHAQRVAELTLKFAHLAEIPEEQMTAVYRGALLHDIGKIAIPDHILFKPGKLTADEWVTMRKHPAYGYQLLSSFSYLKDSLEIPYCHHEKWDGSGYPRGLKGTEIPLSARLFAIVDVWVALTSDRCYRKTWSTDEVINHIQDQSGRHFDPQLVDLFLMHLPELLDS
jgi:diguanylate cyclase (GGDEF)-like protein